MTEEQKQVLLNDIKKCIKLSSRDKAILSLKYGNYELKTSLINISLILASSFITFAEAYKNNQDLNSISLAQIILSSYISIMVAIFKFFKFDEKKENISNIIERFSHSINKYKKTKHDIELFDGDETDWKNLNHVFRTETYDYLINTREMFDSTMTIKDLVHYKEKLIYLKIKNSFTDSTDSNLDQLDNRRHRNYNVITSGISWFFSKLCCYFSKIDYKRLLDDVDSTNDSFIPEIILDD